MKVRCKGCGNVIKAVTAGAAMTCPECGCSIHAPAGESASRFVPTAQTPPPTPDKGDLPTVDKSARNAGCVIMGILLFGIPLVLAIVTGGDDATYWVLAIIALIVMIPLGVWFERNTIRRK